MKRAAAITAVVAAAAAVVATAAVLAGRDGRDGTSYYVAPGGDDRASGLVGHPWRTVERASRAKLRPGDTVRFRGGARFTGELIPATDGVTYESYGGGRATIGGGIWLAGRDRLTFRGLAVSGTRGSAFGSSARGRGSTRITVDDCRFTDVRIGINSANTGDSDWTVTRTTIANTADSGVIVVGRDMTFERNTIVDTGEDSSIGYPRHGVYAKGPSLVFRSNVIRRFSTDGISLRFRDARVEDNTISDGAIGIAFFQNDPSAGKTVIARNRITRVSEAGIYISPSDSAGPTRESFVIEDNVAGRIDVQSSARVTLRRND